MATYIGKIKADGTNELPIAATLYGTCATAAATAAKVVVCANFDKLITGVTIKVKFTYANGVANPTLNVNSTGAIAIMRYGTTRPSTSAATSWNAGAVVSFTYDGTYWQMNDWLVDGNSNTWRNITVNGTAWKGTGTGTGAMNLVSGTNVTLTPNGNDLTIESSGGGATIPLKEDGVTSVENSTHTTALISRYCTCSTAAATAEKTASITSGTFTLEAGAKVTVNFTNANSADNPTLNINSTGAKRIYNRGAIIAASETKVLLRGCVDFVYDGTYWVLVGSYVYSDVSVAQAESTANADYEVLLSASATASTTTGSTIKNPNLKFNPSTGNLTTTLINNSPPVMVATYGTTTYADIKAAYDAGIPVFVYAQNGTTYSKTLCMCSGYTTSYISFWGMVYSNAATPAPYRFITARVSSANAWTNSLSSF